MSYACALFICIIFYNKCVKIQAFPPKMSKMDHTLDDSCTLCMKMGFFWFLNAMKSQNSMLYLYDFEKYYNT